MQGPRAGPPLVVAGGKTGQHDPQGANHYRASDQQPPGDHRGTELVWTTTVVNRPGSGKDRSASLVIPSGADQRDGAHGDISMNNWMIITSGHSSGRT
jgi:hypothetical protein